jgi:DNA (cytosine-5)-methyltransferase 1
VDCEREDGRTHVPNLDIDLFAGAGGLALGLRRAGFSPLSVYEKDRQACETLRYNATTDGTLAAAVFERDVKEITWSALRENVRLLAAGAPCQPFSLAGRHRAQEDERNLFPELLRAVRALKPMIVLVENVRGILRDDFQPFFEYVLRQLEFPSLTARKGEKWRDHDRRVRQHQCSTSYLPEYQVCWRLLEAADYGVPQLRKRVFVIATRVDLPVYRFPIPTHSKSALEHSQRAGTYWERHRIKRDRGNGLQFKTNGANGLAPWVTVRDALADLPPPGLDAANAWMNHWAIAGARAYPGHGGSRLDWPSKTIKAGVHGVPGGENTVVLDDGTLRYYTLREAARIQTFPDQHYFTGPRTHVTRHLGNAVPCLLAARVARPLLALLPRFAQTGVAYASKSPGIEQGRSSHDSSAVCLDVQSKELRESIDRSCR